MINHIYKAEYLGTSNTLNPSRLRFRLDLGFDIHIDRLFDLEGVEEPDWEYPAESLQNAYKVYIHIQQELGDADVIYLQSIEEERADVTYRKDDKWYNLSKSLVDEGLLNACW